MTNHMQGEIIFSVQESPQDGYHTRTRLFQFHCNRYSRRIENDDPRRRFLPHFDTTEKPSVIRLHMLKDEVVLA